MTIDERLDAVEKKIDYLTQLIENHILRKSGSKKEVSGIITNTLSILEKHPAMQNAAGKDMLKSILKPLTEGDQE